MRKQRKQRWLWALATWLLVAAPVSAQNPLIDTGSITAVSSGGACSAAPAGCAVFLLPNGVLPSVTLQVSGTFTATLLFEATSDGTNWKTITGIDLSTGASATGATTTGQFSFQNSGLTGLRVRCTAYTSGTAVTTAVRGYARATWLSPFFTSIGLGTKLLFSSTAPAIASGFGSSPTINAINGTAAFRVIVGTAPTNVGSITLPAATTGWTCYPNSITVNLAAGTGSPRNELLIQTAFTTTSATFGNFLADRSAAVNLAASDVILFSCVPIG